jgi:hypothetical protein
VLIAARSSLLKRISVKRYADYGRADAGDVFRFAVAAKREQRHTEPVETGRMILFLKKDLSKSHARHGAAGISERNVAFRRMPVILTWDKNPLA